MKQIHLPPLLELEHLRGSSVILYASMINDDSVRMLYECLRRMGRQERLNLVLSTSGGNVTSTRQLALLLREYTQHLTILVPYRARSSGTLLCLCADELILGPLAELGPIDPHVGTAGHPPADAPSNISAQDIRAFRTMAEDWFGVVREEDRLQVLALVAQRIFPTSLSSFYRFDLMLHQIANELLVYQLPDVEEAQRKRIVKQLINGYFSHDYIISRKEARNLGLRVCDASPQEEDTLWRLLQASHEYMPERSDRAEVETVGLIIARSFSARQVSLLVDVPAWKRRSPNSASVEKVRDVSWEMDREEGA